MAQTNFAALTTEQKKVWALDVWKTARERSFINLFAGTSHNSMIHRVTELTKTTKGDQAVITLVPDLEDDGVVGDYKLEDNEEAIKAFDQVITIDQLRHANRTTGKMADQRSIVNFRTQSKDVLGHWLGDRWDQMAFLTMSGIPYTHKTNGALRPVKAAGQNLNDLAFASDVAAPTSARHLRWSASGGGSLEVGDTTSLASGDSLTYKALVLLKAYARDQYIKPIKTKSGIDMFHVFVSPQGMASLKLDPDYKNAVINAGVRGDGNQIFKGTHSVTVDGLVIHEFRHVYDTQGATAGTNVNAGAAGYKWGANADVDGQRVLFCGAQALGMCDLGAPDWNEDTFDYNNQLGIATGKMCGFRKPKFHSAVTGDVQDFGIITLDTALNG